MSYYYPFGEELRQVVQQDRSPKKVFVLGVYASAVHARWKMENKIVCQALAVASEPRIFWDGNREEAKEIISRIKIPKELGTLEPAGAHLNGPSAKTLDEHILAPLGFTRKDAWLCDLLPETRLNPNQIKVLKEKYIPKIERYGLNHAKELIPERRTVFCDKKRSEEILAELEESQAELLVLLGDIPIKQFLNRVADVDYNSLSEYADLYGYGSKTQVIINGKSITVIPFAHPRQIGGLGAYSKKWNQLHSIWENK